MYHVVVIINYLTFVGFMLGLFCWVGLDWAELDWVGLCLFGLGWDVLGWTGLGWVLLGCVGLLVFIVTIRIFPAIL